jgi:hypothetical protein
MDGKALQVMCCMFYHNSPIDAYSLAKTEARKGIISYYKTNGIRTLKKHVDANLL